MDKEVEYLIGGLLLFVIIIAIIALIVAIFYLLTLQNLLNRVKPENRTVEPSNVWLMLIPLFSLVYAFILYPKISESVAREYESRGLPPQGDFGKSLGITMPILSLCGIIPFIGGLAGLANLVIWIIFWSKMSGYKNQLS
jgi:hypothetical protein